MRVYSDEACSQESHVVGRRLYDGNCFKLGNTSSLAFSLRTDKTLTRMAYLTPNCTGEIDEVVQYSSATIGANSCTDEVKTYVHQDVYTSPPAYITEIYYADSACTTPSWIRFKPKDVFATFTPVACAKLADGIYYTRERSVTYDNAATTSSIFSAETKRIFGSQATYVTEREFYNAACDADYRVNAYLADGKCINFGGASGTFEFDKSSGKNVRVISAGDKCSGSLISVIRMDPNEMNTGECQYDMKVYASYPDTPAPTTPEPTTKSVRTASASSIAVSVAAVMTILATFAASVFLN